MAPDLSPRMHSEKSVTQKMATDFQTSGKRGDHCVLHVYMVSNAPTAAYNPSDRYFDNLPS